MEHQVSFLILGFGSLFGIGLPLIPVTLLMGSQAGVRMREGNLDPLLGAFLCLVALGHLWCIAIGVLLYPLFTGKWAWLQFVTLSSILFFLPTGMLGLIHLRRSSRSIVSSILVERRGPKSDWDEILARKQEDRAESDDKT